MIVLRLKHIGNMKQRVQFQVTKVRIRHKYYNFDETRLLARRAVFNIKIMASTLKSMNVWFVTSKLTYRVAVRAALLAIAAVSIKLNIVHLTRPYVTISKTAVITPNLKNTNFEHSLQVGTYLLTFSKNVKMATAVLGASGDC